MAVIEHPGSPRHEEQLRTLADFCGLDRVAYEDLGNGENYTLEKDGKQIVLRVSGNRCDGGFLCVDFGQPAATWKDLNQGEKA